MNRLNWPSLQEKRRKAKTHQAVEGKEQPGPHWGITSKLQPLPDRLETWRPRPATPTTTVPHTAQFSFLPTTIKEYRTGGNQRQRQPTLSTPLWWNTSTYIYKKIIIKNSCITLIIRGNNNKNTTLMIVSLCRRRRRNAKGIVRMFIIVLTQK